MTAIEIAVAGRDAAEAEHRGRQVAERLRGPRADYAAALAELAAGRPARARALEAAADAADAAGWRWEAARMSLIGAEALAHVRGSRREGGALAARAQDRLDAIAARTWSRRAHDLARRLGPGVARATDEITPREREVLALLVEGRSNRAIASALVISEATVVRHVANIYAKLGVHSRAQATRVALERGLLAPAPPT